MRAEARASRWPAPARRSRSTTRRSPFDGAHREVYFNQTTVANEGGPRHWWTDPYGGNASEERFPGAICQLVGPSDNTSRPTLESQAFGSSRDYGGRGVHAPN